MEGILGGKMAKKIYIINPYNYTPTYFGNDFFKHYGLSAINYAMNLASATVATMAKQYLEVELCEEFSQPINFETDADIIGITGMISQWERMRVVAETFREMGKIVMLGGAHVSLCPEMARPYCDILVIGEIEDIYHDLFKDIKNNKWKEEYRGTRPDLSKSVAPDLSIYPNELVLLGTLQASRGCPFECEFCDVIQYLGRKQRYKPVDAIISELNTLAEHGYTDVFITDDNLTANRKKAKEILLAITEWNGKRDNHRIGFTTQLSIDSASDPEMMNLMATASIDTAFIGIESPNTASLKSVGKKQNLNLDMARQIQTFLDHGVAVFAGLLVGFDNDTLSTFETIRDFACSVPIALPAVGLLVAPVSTPLYKRLKDEGRIFTDDTAYMTNPLETNIIPKNMSREELAAGTKWLCSNLYHPEMYEQRIHMFLDRYNWDSRPWFINEPIQSYKQENPNKAKLIKDCFTAFDIMSKSGKAEEKLFENMLARSLNEPRTSFFIYFLLLRYVQVRYMYGLNNFYDASLYNRPVFEKLG